MKKAKKLLVISILVAIASQVNLGLLESNFVISAGVVIFASFIYYSKDINIQHMGILTGIMVYLTRLLVHQIAYGYNNGVLISYMPEILFYITYPIFYKLLVKEDKKDHRGYLFIALVVCDFSANYVEVLFRHFILSELNLVGAIPTLLIASLIRSILVSLIIIIFSNYAIMITKREHEDRYKKLLWVTSQLKTEIFWIEKNMDSIEKVMAQSYELFEQITNKQNENEWANKALNIAREVHEIKKENGLVARGIKSITEKELDDKGMYYKEISNILRETMIREAASTNKQIEFEFVSDVNFYTSKHYYLMSVLRNLIMNSMDAIKETQLDAKINLIHTTDTQNHTFQISDNGTGIDEDDMIEIFSPGFSTKINYETGEINRGLGLSIVQDIVERDFKGTVQVQSEIGAGTNFTISIPKITLEENLDENIYR